MRDYYPKFRIGCMEDGKIWFVPYAVGAVFELNIKSESVNFLSMLPVKKYASFTEGAMLKHGGKIYFAPCMGEDFLIYDISKNQFTKLQCKKGGTYKFQSGFYQNQNIYFIGQEQALIARCDLEKERICYIDAFQKEPACKINSENVYWSKGGACINDMHLLVPNVVNPCILDYNIQENNYVLRNFDINNGFFCSIAYANHAYWLFPKKENMILHWDIANNIVRHIKTKKRFTATTFMHPYVWNENIIIIDHQFLDVYFLDTEEELIRNLPVKEKLQIESAATGLTVRWSYIWDSKIYLNIMQRDPLIEYNLETGAVREIDMNMPKESRTRYLDEFQKMRGREFPDKIPYIPVMSLLEKQNNITDKGMYKENIGKRIFQNVSGLI